MGDKTKRVWKALKLFTKDLKHIISDKKENIEIKPNNLFDSLSPKSLNPEDVEIYLEALNMGVKNKEISNIALTGSYGAGKSSLIKTFEEVAKNKFKFLKVSLASFQGSSNGDNLERQLELSILQQIFYHVKSDKIPDSRFKRIKNITTEYLIVFSLVFAFWLFSVFVVFNFNYLDKLNPSNWSWQFGDLDYHALIIFLVFFLGIAYLAKGIVRFLNNSKISKVSIKGEVELGKDIDKSILNEYLDELVYFFERNHYDVVVIEDLDRFESIDIFSKLREINTLINNSEQRKGDVVFLYAIRDDIFTGKDRTKFFDFIIPVIPVINKSNSNEKLRERFESISLENKPTTNFIDDISLFIDDMRLLNNICNEYIIYSNNLSSKLIQDKLLAMIVYKNMMPDDFVDLHNEEGKLFTILNDKKKYITSIINSLDEQILSLNKSILNIENEKIIEVKELRAVYVNALHNLTNENIHSVVLESKEYSLKQLIKDEIFEKLLKSENLTFKYYDSYYRSLQNENSGKTFKDLEKFIESEFNFEKRISFINDRVNNNMESINNQILILKEKKRTTEKKRLRGLFSEIDLLQFIEPEYANNKLLIFLLRNGHIDEDYYDYISYFHNVSMTRSDNEFLQSVKSQVPMDFGFKLNKVETLVNRLGHEYFKRDSILNFDLVDFLFKNKNKYRAKANAIIQYLSENKTYNKRFINEYYIEGKELDSFINLVPENWPKFWQYIEEESDFSAIDKIEILLFIINNCSINDIKILSKESRLRMFINGLEKPLEVLIFVTSLKKINDVLGSLEIKFKNLPEVSKESDVIFKLIYDNNYYSINTNNINTICRFYINKKDLKKYNGAPYTMILKSELKELKNYISSNIEEYINDVWQNNDELQNEEEETIVHLLNNEDLSIEQKEGIITEVIPDINSISDINDFEVMRLVLKNDCMLSTWENVYNIWLQSGEINLINELVDFLNEKSHYAVLSQEDLKPLSLDEDDKRKFALKIIYCDDLTLEAHKMLRRLHFSSWIKLSLDKLSFDKVESMIEEGFISLSLDYYEKLKEDFSDLHIKLLEKDISTFLNKFDDYVLEEVDVKLLLSSTVSKSQKVNIIMKLDENIVINNNDISRLASEILRVSSKQELSYNLLHGLFASNDSNSNKIELFNMYYEDVTREQAKSLASKLSYPFSRFLMPRKRTRVTNSNSNRIFIDNLKKLRLISSYSIKRGNIEVVGKY
ncbi:YobI family P-loop NTPase [Hyunsoonleella ulvae]|uniref:YobI family P-loop NTPase n=1 Tax=Hyunsoonleella ulvae TaxID=2799948 RepID=UPI00193AC60F|nr:hypothetical protein [Hyunsoonleella ulvae]